MSFSLTDVDAATAPLRALAGTDLAGVPAQELIALQRLIASARSAWDVLAADVAGEIAHRSRVEDGAAGLARRHGFTKPEQLVASIMGGSYSDGARLVGAGKVLRAETTADTDSGELDLTAAGERRPHIAAGLREGWLTIAKADLITRTLTALTGDTTELERKLVELARSLDYRNLRLTCSREAARFDAVQLEAREARQYQQRSLTLSEGIDGMTIVKGLLDPGSAIAIRTYLDAQVKAAYQAVRNTTNDGTLPNTGDSADSSAAGSCRAREKRTIGQIQADALVALAVHGLDCTSPASGVKATIVVRINADDINNDHPDREIGIGTCDALTTPISLRLLRHVAVDAAIVPMVMNSKSHCLDMGREQRLFSWYQRLALAERDGGCAKCHAPISHCITHHIRWWTHGGLTDLRNGVLLCVRCHTQVHRDHWGIDVDDDNHVWFTPPKDIDPHQHRQLGGLAALTTT